MSNVDDRVTQAAEAKRAVQYRRRLLNIARIARRMGERETTMLADDIADLKLHRMIGCEVSGYGATPEAARAVRRHGSLGRADLVGYSSIMSKPLPEQRVPNRDPVLNSTQCPRSP